MRFIFQKKDVSNHELVEQIILKQYNQYYRLAYSYVHNEADASDIVQNGVYKALRGCHTLHNQQYAETWIYRIILNECFSHVRRPHVLSYEAIKEKSGLELGYIEDHYENIDLQKTLDELSQKDKAIIILKYFEDRTLNEIANILDENVNTVKSRLYRSLEKLRKALNINDIQNQY